MTSLPHGDSDLRNPPGGAGGQRQHTNPYSSQLTRLCHTHPGMLTGHLQHLADAWDRKGTPPKRLTLAKTPLPPAEMHALGCCFNRALKATSRGVTLDVEDFLKPLDVESWRNALCTVLQRTPRNHQAEKDAYNQAGNDLLEQWCDRFGALAPARSVLAAAIPKWTSRSKPGDMDGLQRDWEAIGHAVGAILTTPDVIGVSDIGARFFADSKAIRRGTNKHLLAKVLAAVDGSPDTGTTADTILRQYGICDNDTALKVTLFGPLRYRKRGRWFDWIGELHETGESATLSMANLRDIDRVEAHHATPPVTVTTTENETPFCNLVRERSPGCLIYTAGYPNAAVMRLLTLLPPDWMIRHWGDSDLDGLRIAAMLGRTRPVDLWRCDLTTLKRHRKFLRKLQPRDIARARNWLQNHPTFTWDKELIFAIENGWLEQEAWRQDTTGA